MGGKGWRSKLEAGRSQMDWMRMDERHFDEPEGVTGKGAGRAEQRQEGTDGTERSRCQSVQAASLHATRASLFPLPSRALFPAQC